MISAADIAEALPYLTPAERADLVRCVSRYRGNDEETLLEFIPRVSPRLAEPRHLMPIVDAVQASLTREVRAVISTPPQHGKTELVKHGLVQVMRLLGRRNAYVTYEATRGEEISQEIQTIATEAGVSWEGNRKRWRTSNGGALIATGIGGPLTGYAVDGVMVVDDPVKNRAEAESAVFRERTHQWFRDVAMTRVHPGASVLVVQTRWHPDDLAGRLIKEGWPVINLPAINDAGEALWPEKRPLPWLEQRRKDVGEYTWASLYQGTPRPRGGRLFEGTYFYEELPKKYREAVGVDLAYTEKTQADWSIAIEILEHNEYWYIANVTRRQVKAPDFATDLKHIHARRPRVDMRWYCAGPEKGSADFIRRDGVPLVAKATTADKFVRAQPVAAMWNRGRILLPRSAPWLDAFLEVVSNFTGVNDANDDDVDALAAGFDLLPPRKVEEAPKPGTEEWLRAEEQRLFEAEQRRAEERQRQARGELTPWAPTEEMWG